MAEKTVSLLIDKSAKVNMVSLYENDHDGSYYLANENDVILLRFQQLSANLLYQKIVSAKIYIVVAGAMSSLPTLFFGTDDGFRDFDKTTVTGETLSSNDISFIRRGNDVLSPDLASKTAKMQRGFPVAYNSDYSDSVCAAALIRDVIALTRPLYQYETDGESLRVADQYVYENNGLHTISAYLDVIYDDAVVSTSKVVDKTFSTGYVDPSQAFTFRWGYELADPEVACVGDFTQASATLYWREAGEESWNSVPINDDTTAYTMPAGTFPAGTVEYYISGTDNRGTSTETAVATLRTAAVLSTATPLRPIDTVVNSSGAVEFAWAVRNTDGSPLTRSELQYRIGSTAEWASIGSVDGDGQTLRVTFPETVPGGVLQWRVRAFNGDSAAGAWSEPVSFTYVAGPPTPTLQTDAAPFATFAWTAEGQLAYRLTVDGVKYGPYTGADSSFRLPDRLAAGAHSAALEIQGAFGLWSNPGTVSFEVQNQAGEPVTLTAAFALDASLSWETEGEAALFAVYRDDIKIAETGETSYLDRLSLGQHSYYVLAVRADGNYTKSNMAEGETVCRTMAIAPAAGGAWLELRTSSNSDRVERYSFSRSHSLRHFRGAEYPVLEQSVFSDLSGSYTAAFMDKAAADRFWALRGQIVILKARGEVTVGLLANVSKMRSHFLYDYSFDLQQIDTEGLT